MSFHHSADIPSLRLENGRNLVGRLRNNGGSFQDASFNLDSCLSNNQGHFQWNGEGFSRTASEIRFAMEGGGNVPVLRAQLRTMSGAWLSADVNLGERIKNVDGQFKFE